MTLTALGRRLLLVGGGHAHVHVLRSLGLRPEAGLQLTFVTKDVETPYSGMLPGLIAGHYRREECHIDLQALARFAGAGLIHAEAIGIDRTARQVLLRGHAPLPYDILSLDIGSTARFASPEAERFVVPIRPVPRFLDWLPQLQARAAQTRNLNILMVGGGVGGVELLLSLQHRLSRMGVAPQFTMVTRGPLLRAANCRTRKALARILRERGVAIRENAEIVAVEAGCMRLADGETVRFDEAVWAAGPGAPHWLRETGLDLVDGFVAIDPCLRATNDPFIFAAGDVATLEGEPRPKAGVFAVRQGPALAENLRLALAGRPLRPHLPRCRYLSLIGMGDPSAVADWGSLHAEGRWVWRLKQWIDRRWISQYQNLPAPNAGGRYGNLSG